MALLQLRSVLMSVAPVASIGHANSRGLDLHLGPCWLVSGVILPRRHTDLSDLCATWAMVTSRPGLLLSTMYGSVVLPQMGFVLKSMAHVATKGHMEVWGLGLNLWPCLQPEAMLLPELSWSEWPVFPQKPGYHPGLSCCGGPCPDSWFSCNWGLCWYLWPV